MRNFFRLICFIGISLISTAAFGQSWSMQKANLMTSFASKIDTNNVLGEYPRPQMVRENWMNLNGLWQFQPGVSAAEAMPAGKLRSRILVPFPVESAISGIMKHSDRLWYRRTFTVPENWANQRVLIHFGAVDYEAEVFVNRHSLGIHTGGYDPFTYDITPYLTTSGPQEITVRVYDPTDLGGQPRGKQTLNPGGIMYTCSSGIWQSVWLEPVPQTSISNIKIVPDIDQSVLNLKVSTSGTASNQTVSIAVKEGENVVATFEGLANSNLVIPISNPKLWSPDSPFLYDLDIKLKSEGAGIDSLKSYFGMRKISMKKVGNYRKMMLNNEFLFHMGPLDQGFWPDGLYTAPTDLALKFDIDMIKKLGFNMIRKHIKVEPYRWYYWADKLGIMVWQDMPSPNSYTDVHPDIDVPEFHKELVSLVETHWNSPSIVMWVVFNEGQAQHDTKTLVPEVMALDTTRLVNQASGGGHEGVGDILDIHSYPSPGCPANNGTQILACGEYGGIGYTIPGHIWNPGWGYVGVNNGTELCNMYNGFTDKLVQYKSINGLSAAVYTEITDVEIELNGLMTYDRSSLKMSFPKIAASNHKAINSTIFLTALLPMAMDAVRLWHFTTNTPADNWYDSTFDDSKWPMGQSGFGRAPADGGSVHTSWTTTDIWLRRSFTIGNMTSSMLDSLILYVNHDDDAEIFINGVLAASLTGFTSNYNLFNLSAESRSALKINSDNEIAIHCNSTFGGQYIDAGVYLYGYDKVPVISAIENNAKTGECAVYPNPAVNELRFSGFEDKTITATVFNSYGAQVLKESGTMKSINVSSLSAGVYFIKIESNNESRSFKFTKKM